MKTSTQKRLKIGDTISIASVNLFNPATQPVDRQIKPMHDRVLIQSLGKALTTADLRPIKSNSGLLLIRKDSNLVDGIEGDYRRTPLLGKVISVGPGKYDERHRLHATTVKPGELVVFSDWNDWDDAPAGLHMVREGDIWGYPVEGIQVS